MSFGVAWLYKELMSTAKALHGPFISPSVKKSTAFHNSSSHIFTIIFLSTRPMLNKPGIAPR